MDPMDMIKGMLAEKMGVDEAAAGGALDTLLSGGGGGADALNGGVGGLLAAMKERGMGAGDINADKLKGLLGEDSVASAAEQLGTTQDGLLGNLTDMLPGLLDKMGMASGVMDKLGGAGALGGMAGKLFKR